MDLAFVIALAAILVPLHHWLEHKVVHYLSHKSPGMHLLKMQQVLQKPTEEQELWH